MTQGIVDRTAQMFAAAAAVVVTARTSVYETVRAARIALADTGDIDHNGGHGA